MATLPEQPTLRGLKTTLDDDSDDDYPSAMPAELVTKDPGDHDNDFLWGNRHYREPRTFHLALDTTSTDLADRIKESKDASDELAKNSVRKATGFTQIPRAPVPVHNRDAKQKMSPEETYRRRLDKVTKLLNADPSVMTWKDADPVIEYVQIKATLRYVKFRDEELVANLMELDEHIRELKELRDLKELEGEDLTEINADILSSSNNRKALIWQHGVMSHSVPITSKPEGSPDDAEISDNESDEVEIEQGEDDG